MPGNILKLLSCELRGRRKKLGLSQEEFAAGVGVSAVFISKIERGVANPTVTVLEKMAVFLGVSMAELFTSVEQQASVDSMRLGIVHSVLNFDENQLSKLQKQISTMVGQTSD